MIETSRGYQFLDQGEDRRRAGQPDAARHCFAEAISVFHLDCDLAGEARALTRQARLARDAGNLEWAQHDQQAAIALLRKAGDGHALARALRRAGDIFLAQGDQERAAAALAEAFVLYEASPDAGTLEIADAVRSVALLAEALGEPEQALMMWQDARERYAQAREAGGNPGLTEADTHIAALARH
ncbi:hypothetical protein ABS767_08650 [Sphingomonas sp. ST-64]|uniref:Tetratricopeptide repeat-containing protein n=1 Tax=Sphingomonas plantiphila TaxID=3163295 RepID=A0ABW8YNL5_9SPHN